MFNKLMHTINLLGWLYAATIANAAYDGVIAVGAELFIHLRDMGIMI
jgi:hypothetical protein